MPFNVSGPFRAQFGIDQLHWKGTLLVQGRNILLVASLNPSVDVDQTVSNLHLIEKVTVPTLSKTKFVVRASSVKSGKMSSDDGIATGSFQFSNCHDLHHFLNVVLSAKKILASQKRRERRLPRRRLHKRLRQLRLKKRDCVS
jgi:hypothetical protein